MNSLVNKKIKPGRGGYSPAEKKRERMKKELYTSYDEWNDVLRKRKFEIVERVPEVGDYWLSGCEVIAVEPVKLDDVQNSSSFGKTYEAYKVSYINAGCDDERDDSFYDYIAIETEVAK